MSRRRGREFVLRDFRASDRAAVARWMGGLALEGARRDPRHFALRRPKEWMRRTVAGNLRSIAKEGGFVLVAEVGGRRAGFLSAKVSDLPPLPWRPEFRPHVSGYVDDLFLEPWARGQGLGRALLDEAVRRFVEMGCDNVQLNVMGSNVRAHRLYRRLGFRDTFVRMRRDVARPPAQWTGAALRRRQAIGAARRGRPGPRKALQRALVKGTPRRGRR